MKPLLRFLAPVLLVACDPTSFAREPKAAVIAMELATPDGPDSMRFLLRRFQSRAGTPARVLEGGTHSLDALAGRYLIALEQRDTAALQSLRVTTGEFAFLYFPESIFMQPPYELDPDVLWMQLDAASRTGMRRALQEYGGRPAGYLGVECRPADVHGATRIHGCDVQRLAAPGDTVRERLFGPILERDGRFKFLSLQNRL